MMTTQYNDFRPLEIQLPHLTVRAKEWGDPEGPPLLGLHGWMDNAATFDRLAPSLRAHRFVALDWSGHGRSDHRPPGNMYHFMDWIPELFDVVDALRWDRFSIIAHSLGAGVSAVAAAAAQARIERMVLIEGIGPLTTSPEDAPELLQRALEYRHKHLTRPPKVHATLAAAVAHRMLSFPLEEESAKLLVQRGTTQTEEGVIFSSDPMLRATSLTRLTEAQVLSFLAEIQCPVLFIRAQESFLQGNELVDTRIETVKDIELLDVPGKHHVHLDHPERIADAVVAFLDADTD